MAPPDETRQLPGVKGQWILAADYPPSDLAKYEETANGQYWRPHHHADPRPFTLPAAPAPEQAAVFKRKFAQLVTHPQGTAIYAVADDGTAWISSKELPDWIEIADLPDREVSDA